MFERYQQDRQSSPKSRWVRAQIAASVIAHGGVVSALVISSWWNIERLSIDRDQRVGIASLGFATAAPPPLAAERRERTTRKLRRTRDLTQTGDRQPEAADGGDGGEGEPDGHADGIAGGTGTDPDAVNLITGCATTLCSGDLPPPPEVKKPERKEPVVVPEAMMQGHLVAGNTQIRAPDAVRVKIARTPTRRVVGVVKLCVDTAGAVTSSRLLESTGHPSYDRMLVAGVRRWRYRPYRVGGEPVPACTSIRFVYILRD